jgi:hypothetical protein
MGCNAQGTHSSGDGGHRKTCEVSHTPQTEALEKDLLGFWQREGFQGELGECLFALSWRQNPALFSPSGHSPSGLGIICDDHCGLVS